LLRNDFFPGMSKIIAGHSHAGEQRFDSVEDIFYVVNDEHFFVLGLKGLGFKLLAV
jgi:hypothetical protein